MKQLLIALLTLALSLGFCVFACQYVRAHTAVSLDDLRLARVQAGDGDFSAAADAILSAEQRWRANEPFYQVVLRHDEVDAVTTGFSSLYQYALAEDADDFAAVCAEMIARIQQIRRMQLPLAHNIL